jgi:hypothetical protein
MAVLSVRWQCVVLCVAALIVGGVYLFTDILDEQVHTQARSPPPLKLAQLTRKFIIAGRKPAARSQGR